MRQFLATVLATAFLWSPAAAQDGPMTLDRLDRLITALDGVEGDIARRGGAWRFAHSGYQVFIFTDVNADRMRIMVPVAEASALREDLLVRLMQANFDTALDARYAIARDQLWSLYLHELSPMSDRQFQSAIRQTLTLAATFGTDYSSGAIRFGGGDSNQ